ncbi:MAG TPA: GDP-mannose 4,6-dehydratase [Candidatus Binataceae bacterium]
MKVVITGGAGFVGCNAASRYLGRGDHVVVIDNLHRAGAASNLKWLEGQGALEFVHADVRDQQGLARLAITSCQAT